MCTFMCMSRPGKAQAADPVGDAIESLRIFEGEFHFALPLRILGTVLLALGVSWGFARFLAANCFLLLIALGLCCLLVSLIADPRGLIRFLPEEAQGFLFNGRIFDILHDDAPVVNAIRKWGPVQLLIAQDGKRAEPIQHLVQNMEPEVLRFVLCRSFLSFMPGPLRLLMLPSEELSNEMMGAKDVKEQSIGEEEVPSVEWIQNFLQTRNQKKAEKIKYPELMPLVASTLGLQLAPFMAYGRSFFRWVQLGAFTSFIGSLLSAGVFFHGSGEYALQRAASGLLQRSVVPDARWTKVAAAMSLLSAGGAIALSIFCERCQRGFTEVSTRARDGTAP